MENADAFSLFGVDHWIALIVVVVVAIGFARLGKRRGDDRRIAFALVAALLAAEVAARIVFIGVLDYPWRLNLPLHICGMNNFLLAAMLGFRSYRLFEVAYFWGVGGTLGAMLTPDLPFGFPSLLFFFFFAGHGLLLWSAVYAVFGYGFRPRLRSVGVALAATAAYALAVTPVNLLLGANYLYLRRPPTEATVLDLFGSGPAYYAGLVLLAVTVCLLCYLPFPLAARFRRLRR